jgi:uncharacterized delta-60 repeat protein
MSGGGIGHPLQSARVALALLLAGLLAVLSGAPVGADVTPGHLDTGFEPGDVDGTVRAIALQSDGCVVIGGAFTAVGGTSRSRIARLRADGLLDTAFNPGTGANGTVYAIALQPDGKIVIGGAFTTVQGVARAGVARLEADGTLDTGFDPGGGAVGGSVYAATVTSAGKVLIGGAFTSYDGAGQRHVARLNGDGSLDASFDPNLDDVVHALAVRGDKVVIGGRFTSVNYVTCNRIARLKSDGSLDTSFGGTSGANDTVNALAVQSDGKVLIGGAFSQIGSSSRPYVARLEADGVVDTSFAAVSSPNDQVWAVGVTADGGVLIGGAFTDFGGQSRPRVARLTSEGVLETAYDPGSGADDSVYALAVGEGGTATIGGDFANVDGTSRVRLARLNGDGTLDTGFDGRANDEVRDIALDPYGRVVIGGAFSQVNGTGRDSVARLHGDGSPDQTFEPDMVDHQVNALAIQPDGKCVIGGRFAHVDNTQRDYVARLEADGSLDLTFDPGDGPNGAVLDLAVQEDGKVLIVGVFDRVGATSRSFVARLEADGSLDPTFDPGQGANGQVRAVALTPDGKILIGGDFTTYDALPRDRVALLQANGTLDYDFDTSDGPDGPVYAVMAHGTKVLVGGDFDRVGGIARAYVARLESDGSLDLSFDAQNANHAVHALAIAANGKILVGGAFTQIGGGYRNRVAQLALDGSLDTDVDPGFGANGSVLALAVQPDDKVVIGGAFDYYDGSSAQRIARLNGVRPLSEAIYLPFVLRQ